MTWTKETSVRSSNDHLTMIYQKICDDCKDLPKKFSIHKEDVPYHPDIILMLRLVKKVTTDRALGQAMYISNSCWSIEVAKIEIQDKMISITQNKLWTQIHDAHPIIPFVVLLADPKCFEKTKEKVHELCKPSRN